MSAILSHIAWPSLMHQMRKETKNRECEQPLLSMYRWWARRPHSLIGAILDASTDFLGPDPLIADPFSGGGTVAIEATRRSISILAQDLNPWATWGLSVGLTRVDPSELQNIGDKLLDNLRNKYGHVYGLTSNEVGNSHHAHTFRVRTSLCRSCYKRVWLFPYPLITIASRSQDERHAFWGCRICGAATKARMADRAIKCHGCGSKISPSRSHACPHCAASSDNLLDLNNMEWSVVLIQHCQISHNGRPVVEFRVPTKQDLVLCNTSVEHAMPSALLAAIPDGVETKKLLRFGFARWADLYPIRQISALLAAQQEVMSLDVSNAIRERLLLCLIGAAEMPGYVSRWDRCHPKIFEGLANHRYSFDGLAVEPNPLAIVGRGRLARRFKASVAAAEWLESVYATQPKKTIKNTRANQRFRQSQTARTSIITGSSECLPLADQSVALILTDPPYFDSVRYGELSLLFLAWMNSHLICKVPTRFQAEREAVPRGRSPNAIVEYEAILTNIFRECARVLRPEGRLIMTFHNRTLKAWSVLGRTLHAAGFWIHALAVAQTENGRDHSKRDKAAQISDLILECSLIKRKHSICIAHVGRSAEERELVAVGQAIAEVGVADYQCLCEEFLALVKNMKRRKIEAPRKPGTPQSRLSALKDEGLWIADESQRLSVHMRMDTALR